VRLVVPELQRRGLFHREYAGGTLRENVGLPRPQRGDWAWSQPGSGTVTILGCGTSSRSDVTDRKFKALFVPAPRQAAIASSILEVPGRPRQARLTIPEGKVYNRPLCPL